MGCYFLMGCYYWDLRRGGEQCFFFVLCLPRLSVFLSAGCAFGAFSSVFGMFPGGVRRGPACFCWLCLESLLSWLLSVVMCRVLSINALKSQESQVCRVVCWPWSMVAIWFEGIMFQAHVSWHVAGEDHRRTAGAGDRRRQSVGRGGGGTWSPGDHLGPCVAAPRSTPRARLALRPL